jgi:Ca-activated chloride channel homolog
VSTIAYGQIRDSGRRRAGGPVPADTETLAALADATGGGAYTAADGDELDAVYADIGSQLGTVTEDREVWRWFAVAALVLLALAGAVSLLTSPRLP